MKPLIHIHDLSLFIESETANVAILKAISLDVYPNEVMGLMGRSGSGKSMLASVIMHLHGLSGAEATGQVIYLDKDEAKDLLRQQQDRVNEYRRTHSSIVFQNPETALNPRMTCGQQIAEAIHVRMNKRPKGKQGAIIELLRQVKLDEPERIAKSYPHELSGGQLQRVVIAIALAKSPKLLIADELTSSLDKSTEREILKLLLQLKEDLGLSILFISHDIALVRAICQRVAVIDQGEIIHIGPIEDMSQSDDHPVIRQLLSSQLSLLPSAALSMESGEELIRLSSVSKSFQLSRSIFKTAEQVNALDHISASIYASEIVGLVGESGSGKSTLAKLLVGLEKADSGSLSIKGRDIWKSWRWHRLETSQLIQIVFQNPYQSLNPKQTAGAGIKELLLAHGRSRDGIMNTVEALLLEVGLSSDYLYRYPSQMSGGEQQRVCIAKALAVQPAILICDECVSALDSVSKLEILQLLLRLNQERQLTIVFISHDIEAVMAISQRVLVLQKGRLIYQGGHDGLHAAEDEYIRALLGHDHSA